MKACGLLFCGLAGVLATGCSHKPAGAPAWAPKVSSLAAPSEVTVPLPAQTAYDGNSRAKAVYLEFFAMGYRYAASGFAPAGCMCGSEGAADYYEASMNGFLAGKEAGAAAGKRPQNQAPPTTQSENPGAPAQSR
jgi:hypothetical protein